MEQIKRIQIQMLKLRGYDIDDDLQPYNRLYGDVYVHYFTDKKIVNDLKIFVNEVKNINNGIIVADDVTIKKLKTNKYNVYFDQLKLKHIQMFTYDELSFNVVNHAYVPKHEKIDKGLVIPILANANQLPVLLLSDPIVKFYDFRPGDVIKVTDTLSIDMINNVNVSYCIVINQSK